MKCVFCETFDDLLYEDDLFYVIYDKYPVSKGHVLLISKRHVENYFELNSDELQSLQNAISYMKDKLDDLYHPDGYNIGVNCGVASGQTVMHLHVHLIPRYIGDVENPEGGVRGVIPSKQKYRHL